jgi:hypothetical protein
VAQTFQAPDQGAAGSVHIDPIKVIGTKFKSCCVSLREGKTVRRTYGLKD